ncbi:hypothetical protein RhiXN_07312 [Rhizoctonia solani]|uniref:Uncharacterized protein n=1 Tax=Rhizoctonia solani TaxID=456999 RepID=A0A8H7H6K6_9AGAM|nr:uncharacterized protein RhiXN_07312 [Rhizoctonia solani]KAF8678705.1 hypothetical protein RHS04_05057 [Rhizoctonia solani]QRW25363.1 hypothetical protein RhiXN_07312 [Rhizoctonia solani]
MPAASRSKLIRALRKASAQRAHAARRAARRRTESSDEGSDFIPEVSVVTPEATPLAPEVVEQTADELRDLIILFRLNQIHNGFLTFRKVSLVPYSNLGLLRTPIQEYRAIISGTPRFVFKQNDWDRAFEVLGEVGFHVFRREELQIAAREKVILPKMEKRLKSYVERYPLDAAIDRHFRSFKLPTPTSL